MLQKLYDLYVTLNQEEKSEFWDILYTNYSHVNELQYILGIYNDCLINYENLNNKMDEMCKNALEESKKHIDVKQYLKQHKSFIFPVLFQPPIVTHEEKLKRQWIFAIYSGWDANKLCLEYFNKLDKVFNIK